MTKQHYRFSRLDKVLIFSIKRYLSEKYSYRASALSFTTVLALVPLLSVVVFVSTIFPFFTELVNTAKRYAFDNFVPTSSAIIQNYLELFANQTKNLPMFQVLFLFLTVFLLVMVIKNIINTIWYSPRYSAYNAMMGHWLVILSVPVFIGAGIYITYYMLTWVDEATSYQGLKVAIAHLVPILINMLSFSMLYWIVPNCKVNFKDSMIGGTVAAVLIELTKIGFILYIENFPSYELIYGALAVIPIFLLWIYLTWSIIILGAIVTQASEHLELQ